MDVIMFAKGDTVRWDPSKNPIVGFHPRQRHGEGPFRVTEVQDVPTSCGCPGGRCLGEPFCDGAPIKRVGHPQFVKIALNDDTPEEGKWFSGLWVVHA